MSYDIRSSFSKNEGINHHSFGEASFDTSFSKPSKRRIKAKRNSSISKMSNQSNLHLAARQTSMKHHQNGMKASDGYGGSKY